ncbi:MAG: nitronate monooxygenase [Devosia sp.]
MKVSLHSPVCDLLGCRYPIVLAGMGGVARAELVAAVTAGGGFGFLGMVRESPALIREQVAELRRLGHVRFGVNLIPAATPPALLGEELDACIDLGVHAVCLFWDIDPAVVRRLRQAGILVVYQVGSAKEAAEAEAAGAQIIIAQGVEAGGHVRGTRPLHDLIPEVVSAVKVPVLAAGGISDGADVVMALALGAQGAVIGTAMIPTPESFAHDFHKVRLLAAVGNDTVLTQAFHINWPAGAAVRVLASDVTSGLRGDPKAPVRQIIGWEDGRPIYLFSTDSPLRSTTGDFEAMPLYAGAGVGRVSKMIGAGGRLAGIVGEIEQLLLVAPSPKAIETSSSVCYAADADPEYMGYLGREALAERLVELRDIARAALSAARHVSSVNAAIDPAVLRLARWTVILTQLAAKFDGDATGRLPEAGAPVASPKGRLIETLRQLLPLVGDEDVGGVLNAAIADIAQADRASGLQLWGNGGVVVSGDPEPLAHALD